MEFQLKSDFPVHRPGIRHQEKIMLLGSCFTEHISKRLADAGFRIVSNPHGILFNPLSVCHSLEQYMENRAYAAGDLFELNELYNSWDFHTRFSHTQAEATLEGMNQSMEAASAFIRDADWLIITLGSAYQYFLTDEKGGEAVANCHRAPGQWFEKKMLPVEGIINALSSTLARLKLLNPTLKVIFTISPVRHIRDGVINNNRSKARLLEAVHTVVAQHEDCSYFPAYELVIDILRDYRFYDIDMVHPNYPATQFVWEQFAKVYFDEETQQLVRQVTELNIARNHRPRFPDTEAHEKFLAATRQKIAALQTLYPYIDFEEK